MMRPVNRAKEMFWIDGTRMLGCVLRQNDRIETMMKNTDIVAATCDNRIDAALISCYESLMP